jgi:hypothetical protein
MRKTFGREGGVQRDIFLSEQGPCMDPEYDTKQKASILS